MAISLGVYPIFRHTHVYTTASTIQSSGLRARDFHTQIWKTLRVYCSRYDSWCEPFEVGRTHLRVFSNLFPSSVTSVCLKNLRRHLKNTWPFSIVHHFNTSKLWRFPRFCSSTRPWTSDRASVFELQEVVRQASTGYNGYNGFNGYNWLILQTSPNISKLRCRLSADHRNLSARGRSTGWGLPRFANSGGKGLSRWAVTSTVVVGALSRTQHSLIWGLRISKG